MLTRYSGQRKEEILKAYFVHLSMRGIARTFGIARQTLNGWLKEQGHQHADLEPALDEDAGEQDLLEYHECGTCAKKPERVALDSN